MAALQSRARSAWQALCMAYTEDEHAVFMVKLPSSETLVTIMIGILWLIFLPRSVKIEGVTNSVANYSRINASCSVIVTEIRFSRGHLF